MRFDYPESLRRGYLWRLNSIANDARQRLRRVGTQGLSSAEFEQAAQAIRQDVLRERQSSSARWFAEVVELRSNRDFRKLTGGLSRSPDARLLEDARRRQMGTIESLVDQLVQAQIDHYAEHGTTNGFNIAPHRARARFYAQDQVGQIYNALTKQRATFGGSSQYVWVRTTSKNPRDFHLERVGRTYTWGELDDEPGVLPNCKCTARPVMN